MKIGMLTGLWYIAEHASLIASLHRASALGFHYVDFQGVFHAGPNHLSPKERRAVKAELSALGLEARNYVLHAPKNIASATAVELRECRDYLREGMDLANEWGIRQIMLNAGQWDYHVTRETAWEKAVEFVRTICDDAARQDIFIAVESEPYVWYLLNDVRSTERFLHDVQRDNLTVLIDLGHLALAREGPAEMLRLGDRIIHAHFSDHRADQHTNQVIGTGITRTAEYLNALRQAEIDRLVQRFGYAELVISFELGFPGDRIEDPDSWVRRSLNYVQSIAPYMKQ